MSELRKKYNEFIRNIELSKIFLLSINCTDRSRQRGSTARRARREPRTPARGGRQRVARRTSRWLRPRRRSPHCPMIESRVPADTPGELGAHVKPERQRRDRRSEDVPDCRNQDVGHHDRPEFRQGVDKDRAPGEERQGHDDEQALCPCGVDRGADRRLYRDSQQTPHGRHHPDR